MRNRDAAEVRSLARQFATGGAGGPVDIADVTGLEAALDAKQATLVSGTNIKTVNGASVLGSGDLVVSGGSSPAISWII